MQIPDSVIREIRERADIVETISSCGIEMRRAGSDFVALCPFHNEKTPSFHIHPTTGYYKCFGCGKSGDAIAFLQEYQGMTFVDAITNLANRYGVELKKTEDPAYARRKRLLSLLSEISEFYRRCLEKTKEADSAREYLSSRGIDKETQTKFGIGYAPQKSEVILTWAQKYKFSVQELADAGIVKMPADGASNNVPYHRFSGRLMFPIKDSAGRVVGFSGRQLVENKKGGKYVNSPETEVFKKGNILYGLDKAAPFITKSPHREAILCEGQIDCIRLHISGFPVAVAPQGTAFTPEHATVLKRYADSVVLIFDDDTAGHNATIKASRILLGLGMPVRVVSLPDGDDPDSFLSSKEPSKGPDAFKELLANAKSAISSQCRIFKARESNPNSIDAIQRISKQVLETISVCTNAVLKDTLLTEASVELNIPKEVLQDELENTKAKPIVVKSVEIPVPDDDEDASSDSSADIEPVFETEPSPFEKLFLSVVAAIENNEEAKAWLKETLEKNASLYQHMSCSFVRDFISAFLAPEFMPLAAFGEKLQPKERGWFDSIMSNMSSADSVVFNKLNPIDILRSSLAYIARRNLPNPFLKNN